MSTPVIDAACSLTLDGLEISVRARPSAAELQRLLGDAECAGAGLPRGSEDAADLVRRAVLWLQPQLDQALQQLRAELLASYSALLDASDHWALPSGGLVGGTSKSTDGEVPL